ncbi:MAG: DUF932 domain-containing protein [Candidatus Heimdallarchaeaceae archaeon]
MNFLLPWSGVSKNIDGVKTAEEAISVGGLDWKVDLRNLYLSGDKDVDGIPVIGRQVKNRFGVVRDTDNEVLGIVTRAYKPIQNRECFSFFDGIVEQNLAKYIGVGQLDNGRRIFIVAEMPNSLQVKGDEVRKALFLSSSHDGTSSVSVSLRAYRLICSNGLVAEIPGQRSEVRIQHSSQYQTRFSQAREVLGIAESYYKQLEIVFNQLVDTRFSREDMQGFTEDLFPATEDVNGNLRVTVQRKRIREKVNDLFVSGIGNNGETAWDAYNATTEYVDHWRNVRNAGTRKGDESRYSSTMLGSGAQIKQRALELLGQRYIPRLENDI